MEKKELEEQRKFINSKLEGIIELAEFIKANIKKGKHPRCVTHISLNPESDTYIVDTSSGFTAEYKNKEGIRYEISIQKRHR